MIGCRIDDLVVPMCEHCAYLANQLLIDWTEKRDFVLGVDWTHQVLRGGRGLGAQWSEGMTSLSFGPMVVAKAGLTVWWAISDRAFDCSRFGFTLGAQDSGIRWSAITALRFARG